MPRHFATFGKSGVKTFGKSGVKNVWEKWLLKFLKSITTFSTHTIFNSNKYV